MRARITIEVELRQDTETQSVGSAGFALMQKLETVLDGDPHTRDYHLAIEPSAGPVGPCAAPLAE